MALVYIPSLLRTFTAGQDSVRAQGATVRAVIDSLDAQFPGIKNRLVDGNDLRRGLVVAIGDKVSQQGLSQPVSEDSEVHFVLSISGG